MGLRHRRWLAVVALFGLLFQQAAMAGYRCHWQLEQMAAVATQAVPSSGCHDPAPDPIDPARCHNHCHPPTATPDLAANTHIVAALLPTSWSIVFAEPACAWHRAGFDAVSPAVEPPIRTRYCTRLN